LRENDIHRWHTRFIDDLQAARGRSLSRRITEVPAFHHH